MRKATLLTIVAVYGFALASGCSSGPSKGSEVGNPAEEDVATPLLKSVRLTDRIELRYSDRFAFAGSNGSYELTEAADGSPAVAIAVAPLDAATILTLQSCPISARYTSWQGLKGCWIDGDLFATDGEDLVALEFHKTVDLANEMKLSRTDIGLVNASTDIGLVNASGDQPSGTSLSAQKTGLEDWDWTGFVINASENLGGEDGEGAPEISDMQVITPGAAEDALPFEAMTIPGPDGGNLPEEPEIAIDIDVVKAIKNASSINLDVF